MTPTPRPQQDPEGPEGMEGYLGLTPEGAERRAREHGWTTVRALPKGAVITLEYVAGRLNLEVHDGAVVRCWRG